MNITYTTLFCAVKNSQHGLVNVPVPYRRLNIIEMWDYTEQKV